MTLSIEHIVDSDRTLKIGVIDADLLDDYTRYLYLTLLKITGFCKSQGHKVRLICNYDEIRDNER